MSSRYTAPRDRSPPRHSDRRPSATYTPGPSTYRGAGDSQASPLDRPPPRGPKADFRGGGYQFSAAPRGRGGIASRGSDGWDRERDRDRDARNAPPPYRRDDDRTDWPRRERDFVPSDRGVAFTRERGYVGRDRSASPERPRRNSRDSIPPAFNSADFATSYYGPAARGGSVRGRGRGDWERGRGRPSFVSERDREFFPRSRSREEWRDRDRDYDRGRPAGPDVERGERFDRRDRREYDRTDERDVRSREHDIWQRDRSPGRNSTGRPASPGAQSTVSQHDRYKTEYDTARKPSLVGPPSARADPRREAESDYFSARNETPRRDGPLSQQFQTTNVPQSSSLGLDYGPPASVPATTPSVQEKPPAPKPQLVKTDFPPVSVTGSTTQTPITASMPVVSAVPTTSATSTILQPPSGPKADRVGPPVNAPSTPRAANQQYETWTKTDVTTRPLRPGPSAGIATQPNETGWRPGDNVPEARAPGPVVPDRPLPANVPSGPRAASGPFRGRLLSNEQAAPNAPPTAPRQPKANTLENRTIPNAPTGPRSSTFPSPGVSHNLPPTGPQAGSNRQWVAPDYRPAKPSIMNQMNKPYQPEIRERSSISGPSMRPGGVTYQSQQSKPKITQPMGAESASHLLSAKAVGLMADTPSGTQTPMDEDMVDSPADIEMSLPASDDEDVEDDEELDEDYFAASEETHLREMKLLESKKPLPPLLDQSTAAMIIKIQLLTMIKNDIVPEAYDNVKASVESTMELDVAPGNAPLSPEHTPDETSRPPLEHPRLQGRPLSQPARNPIPTPPIDELPFLNDAMEDCHVFEEMENDSERSANTMLLCETFEHETWEESGNLDDLRAFYRSRYPLWRRDVDQAEQRLREVHQPSPAPASPAPSATPSLPPGPDRSAGERTRGARNTTDLDMQQAILMSQQSAKEEEERREREAASNAFPNYETEAEVPYMIKPTEADLYYFEDTNKLIDLEYALDIYEFVPPEDDFTDEEQAAFIAAYCQNPKKWGKIADSIPGRTYQDCITHYYLTKSKANYKEHWRRSQPKRGRRRGVNVKPRANNLMSDLALNEEGDGTPVAVTDSGRPRRAAAPTFGDAPDPEAASMAVQAKKSKENIKDTDPSQPKPRGRKGAGTGKGRKPKEKVLVDPSGHVLLPAGAPEASHQKLDRGITGKEKLGRSGLKGEAFNSKLEPHGIQTLAAQVSLDGNSLGHGDVPLGNIGPAPVQVTSYWSVPEQQKFPYLVQYFGRDYSAIAAFLKTKSAIMIKNYYTRELGNGKSELEQYANIAEEKRARGEPMGPPPTPVLPPKRRYEATPSMAAIPRQTAAANEHTMAEAEASVPNVKPIVEDFPANSIQRVAGEVIAKPRPPRETIHHSPGIVQVHPKVEEGMRNERPSLLQKPLSGPPRGFFADESMAYAQHHQKMQIPPSETSSQQHPAQATEHRPTETRSQQSMLHKESRSGDFSRVFPVHSREAAPQQQQAAALPSYQPMPDRNMHHQARASNNHHSSLSVGQNSHEQAAADLASLRHIDVTRNIAYSAAAARSPIATPAQAPVAPPVEGYVAVKQPPMRSEPPKTAKRSNVFSILNDEPEPPVKKPSLESSRPSSINTPPPQVVSAQPSMLQSRHQDDNGRSVPQPYRIDPVRQEYRQEYSSSPAQGDPNDPWLARFDPRQQSQVNEQRPAQHSPASGPYSIIPPSSQSSPAAAMQGRYEPMRSLDPSNHRRSLLGISSAPSPPPQQQPQSGHLHRTSSGSSQHGRGPSVNYQQTATSGSSGYPHSTSATPVPSLHHRNQQSIDQPRLTIQQHMREQEQAMHAQRRDIDIMQHPQQPSLPQQAPSQPPSRLSDRRDIYGSTPESRSVQQHHIPPPPPSQTPQPQQMSMSYSTAPPGRTYTPPHPGYNNTTGGGAHSHSHSHQQQYQSHPSQYSHPAQQGPGQQQQQQHHQPYQGHPAYGPPPHHQRNVHPLSGAPQPQHGHYRGYSTEERR